MHLTLSLTHACNLQCSYCYAGRPRRATMTWPTTERAIDWAAGLNDPENQLGFFGGEPLLEWPLLQRAVRHARAAYGERELKLTVTTNGTLLDDEKADWLVAEGVFVAVSLDGNRAMHEACRGQFDAALAGLQRMLSRTDRISAIAVVSPANVTHLPEAIHFLVEELGVQRVSLNPDFPAAWSEDTLALWRRGYEAAGDAMISRYRTGQTPIVNGIETKIVTAVKEGYAACDRCKFGEGEVAVAPSGNLYPCERLIGEDRDSAFVIGDIEHGFNASRRMEILLRRGNRDPECANCAVHDRCMNWCGCVNWATTGHTDSTGPTVCFHERLCIEVADRVASTLYAERNPPFLARFYGIAPAAPRQTPGS